MRIDKLLTATIGLVAAGTLSGCLVVGHSSRGGWFMFPGGGLVLLMLVLFLLLRRR